MNYVKTDNEGNILQYPYTIAMFVSQNTNISFPSEITEEFLNEFNIFKVEHDGPVTIQANTKLKTENPTFENGIWKYNYTLVEKTQEEIDFDYAKKTENIRMQRNKLLLESDWVVAKAYEFGTEVPQEWKEYRQALRDIPSQEGFPFVVIFPQLPTV